MATNDYIDLNGLIDASSYWTAAINRSNATRWDDCTTVTTTTLNPDLLVFPAMSASTTIGNWRPTDLWTTKLTLDYLNDQTDNSFRERFVHMDDNPITPVEEKEPDMEEFDHLLEDLA